LVGDSLTREVQDEKPHEKGLLKGPWGGARETNVVDCYVRSREKRMHKWGKGKGEGSTKRPQRKAQTQKDKKCR